MKYRHTLLLILPFVFSYNLQAQDDKGFEISKNLEIFANVYKTLHQNYVDDVDPGKAMKKAIDAMLASMDPYTNYYPESDMEDVKMQLLGQYGGVGALIHQDEEKNIFISEPYEGLPADKAGLKAGDRIVAVNGESTEGKSNSDVSSAMRGQAGTDVAITVERDGKRFTRTITRKEIVLPNVPYSGMVGDKVGYVKLSEFTQDAGGNVREAFRKLKQEHPDMRGFILDLRGNGGGLMNEAVDVVNTFVRKGELVVETKGKVAAKNMKSFTRLAPEDMQIPLVVLVDGYSASASEIVSGSLQDLDRAVIVGTRSFGKGLVQEPFNFSDGSGFRLTVARYYTPSGRCIQKPYTEDYHYDIIKRYNDGEMTDADSIKVNKDEAFYTAGGRKVYGGGGIIPDVFVPIDTTGYTDYIADCNRKSLIIKYANKVSDLHRAELRSLKDIGSVRRFVDGLNLKDGFIAYSKENGLNPTDRDWEISGNIILVQIRALVARYTPMGDDAFYPIYLSIDNVMDEVMKK